jgi:hypothetical protein
MAATQLQLNWTGVQFGSVNIIHVTSCSFSQGGELIEFSGDNSRYPVIIANNVNRPKCSITGGDVATLMGFTDGLSGTILATQQDALGATGGAINWSLINAVHETTDDQGQWGAFATATATFRAYSSDGATNPLTIASRS